MEKSSVFDRIKKSLQTKDWWIGFLGNMFSTMVGIALTVGVAELVSYEKDKQQAREMMFMVARSCQENEEVVAMFDSLFQKQSKDVDRIVALYHKNGNDLSSIPDDTLNYNFMRNLNGIVTEDYITRTRTDNYFFSAQMMHQFGNTKLYTEFADYVLLDKETFSKIDLLIDQWISLSQSLCRKKDVEGKSLAETLKEVIEDHKLTDYGFNIRFTLLQLKVKLYKYYSKRLLKVMDASQEELDEYIKSNSTIENDIDDLDMGYVDSERDK